MQYVPVEKTLEMLIQMPGFKKTIEENVKKVSSPGKIVHFRSGSLYKKHENIYKDCLIIDLFYDDVEIANPLESKAGKHKLAQFYFSISDFPDYINSTTRNSFLLASLKTNDMKICGPNVVLKPIVEELNHLFENGVTYYDQELGERKKIKVALGKLRGDNLGQHCIMGFAEGFTANFPCIMCSMSKEETRTAVLEIPEKIRTQYQLVRDAELMNLSASGVKFLTYFEKLTYVDAIDLPSFDIMHDLFEGIIPDVLICLLDFYTFKKKYFTLQKFNHRLESFNYGLHYGKSKPRELKWQSVTGKAGFGLTSSQTIALMVFFPLIIGDLVPLGCQYWEVYMKLRMILDIVMSSELSISEIGKLKLLTQEFLQLYKACTGNHLKPKFHHLTHYATAIRRDGPLKRYWSMTFEANHRFFKKYMQLSCNFRNVPKTVASKYQLQKCFQLMANPTYSGLCVSTNNSEQVTENTCGNFELLSLKKCTNGFMRADEIIVNGGSFVINSFVYLGYVDSNIGFGKILDILWEGEKYFFAVEVFDGTKNEHYCAYEIASACKKQLVPLEEIKCYHGLFSATNFAENDTDKLFISEFIIQDK